MFNEENKYSSVEELNFNIVVVPVSMTPNTVHHWLILIVFW